MQPLRIMTAYLVPFVASAYMYEGDLTYYGGAGSGGACTQKYVPSGYLTIALNHQQYDDGHGCGMCLQGCILNKPNGKECFKAIVDNECPECKNGDLDMGSVGDGRWRVAWDKIECPVTDPKFHVQGSNPWYLKLKIEGQGQIIRVLVNDKDASHTRDDYWVLNDPSGRLSCPPTITFTRSNGSVWKGCMSKSALDAYGAGPQMCTDGAKACNASNVTSTPPKTIAGKGCENGLLNATRIRGKRACCPKSCTKCGGTNCSKLPGGAHNCCRSNILRDSRENCKKSAAPCTVYG